MMLSTFSFTVLKFQNSAGPNVHVVHWSNRASTPQDLYTMTLLASHEWLLRLSRVLPSIFWTPKLWIHFSFLFDHGSARSSFIVHLICSWYLIDRWTKQASKPAIRTFIITIFLFLAGIISRSKYCMVCSSHSDRLL